MMKLMIVGRRRGGMTVAQLHRYMLDVHGAMVVRAIAEQPDLTPQRYVQNHVFDGSTRVPRPGPADALAASRDFVTQVWFKDPAQARASVEAPFYLAQLRPDEDRFVDQTSVSRLPVADELVFDAAHAGRSKLFVFHRRAEAVSLDDLAAATRAAWQPMLEEPALGIGRWVRNRVMARPDEPAAADLVDEVWLRDEAAARDAGERWQALLADPSASPLHAPGEGFVLLAREHVLFAGAA